MPLKTALRWLHFSSLVVYRTITWAILGCAFAFALIVLAVPLGAVAAMYPGQTPDRITTAFSLIGLSVPQFIAGGGIVLACNLALTLDVAPKFKERDKSTDEAAHKAAVAALIPGVILQPSGVFAAIRAQQVGCTYVRAS